MRWKFAPNLKFVSLLLLMCGYQGLVAQEASWLLLKEDWPAFKSDVSLYGRGAYASNVFDNAAVQKFIYGGEISEDHIARMSEDLKAQNRLGEEAFGGIRCRVLPAQFLGSERWGYQFAIENHSAGYSSFSEDFFRLVFEGNKDFTGKTARLDHSESELVNFQKIGFGLVDKNTLSSVQLSYVNGQDIRQLSVNSAELYTTADGDSIYLHYNAAFRQSDTLQTGFGSANAWGMALDAHWNLPLENAMLSLSLSNVGFAKWNGQSIVGRADSNIWYTGVPIEALIDGEAGAFSIKDSLFIEEQQETFSDWLPMVFKLNFRHKIGEDALYHVGVSLRNNAAYIPGFELGYSRIFGEGNLCSAAFYAGGYGPVSLGLSYEKYLTGGWLFQLGTRNMMGLFLSQMKGRDAYLAVVKRFE